MRIGINVPNELLQQVKQIRPSVNISQVCRESLEHRVEAAQRATAQAVSDGAEKQAARLACSIPAPPIEPDWETYALEDAREWVNAVTPEKWEQFTYQSDFLRRQGRDEAEMVDIWSRMEKKGLRFHLWEHQDWFISQYAAQFQSGISSDPHYKATNEYTRAWLGYVNEVRRLLERHHKEKYDRMMAEQAEYRRSLPGPELPPQLL